MTESELRSSQEYHHRIRRCLAYIQEHIREETRLEDLARVACFSKYHFHRIFSAIVGETPSDYVKRLRLERSAILLLSKPSLSVTDIALESGFSSSSVFAREFNARYGTSPSRYRVAGRVIAPEGLPVPGHVDMRGNIGTDTARYQIKRLGPFNFAHIMHAGGYGPGIGAANMQLFSWAFSHGLVRGTQESVGIPWDNPEITPRNKCRYSVCLSVPVGTQGSGPVTILEIPERSYLCATYDGPESGLSTAYSGIYSQGLLSSGFEPDDAPTIDFYRAEPTREADPVFQLEIAVPIVPLG